MKTGSDELFVTCSNINSENKIAKPIKNYLDLFTNTCLNHMSIRSSLESQPNNKLISNSEQLFNATDLSPIAFGVILPPDPRGKILTNYQISLGTLDEKKNLKVCTVKILLESGASVSSVRKDVLYINYVKPLILLL